MNGYIWVYFGNMAIMGMYGYTGMYSTKCYCCVLYWTVMSVCKYGNI